MRDKKKTLEKNEENLKLRKIVKKHNLQEKGITLIALVVTIVILLILAGVTLNIALSDNGLFSKAKKAADDYNQKSIGEELQILYAEKQMENYANKLTVKTDVTELLEEKIGEGKITQEDIEEFNKYLEEYGEKIRTISNEDELRKIGQESEKNYPIDGIYVQLEDIETVTTSIGTEEKPFTGVYNGNGKSINSININATSDDAGMFGVNNGIIKNVTIDNCNITSSKGLIGAIAGKNKGIIENCNIKVGTISSKNNGADSIDKVNGNKIGGVCGEISNGGIIRNCTNSANVTGAYKLVGGICGFIMEGNIENCTNNGVITGSREVGGIVGRADGISGENVSYIRDCKNEGVIKGIGKPESLQDAKYRGEGGIAGMISYTNIVCCKNKGNIEGSLDYVGGIVGASEGSVEKSYNICRVEGTCRVRRSMWKLKRWWNSG